MSLLRSIRSGLSPVWLASSVAIWFRSSDDRLSIRDHFCRVLANLRSAAVAAVNRQDERTHSA